MSAGGPDAARLSMKQIIKLAEKDPEVLRQILTDLNEIMMQDVVAKRLATRAQQHSSATR